MALYKSVYYYYYYYYYRIIVGTIYTTQNGQRAGGNAAGRQLRYLVTRVTCTV